MTAVRNVGLAGILGRFGASAFTAAPETPPLGQNSSDSEISVEYMYQLEALEGEIETFSLNFCDDPIHAFASYPLKRPSPFSWGRGKT